MDFLAFASIPAFLATLLMLPVFGFAAVAVVRWMVDGNLSGLQGTIALAVLIAMFAAGIKIPHDYAPWIILGVVVTLMVLFPFAEEQLNKADLRVLNSERIDAAHAALAARPDNIPAAFNLARMLYEHGYRGHGIAIADNVLNTISAEINDPLNQTSLRDHYRSEAYELKRWKTESTDPRFFAPLKCPVCGGMNPPGPLACIKCSKPYLLELARGTSSTKRVVGKLVLAWALLGLMLTLVASALMSFKAPLNYVVAAVALAGAGSILGLLFKPPHGEKQRGPFA